MWWGGDDAWYTGRVASYDAEIAGHTVKYDDGEEETYAMTNEKVSRAVNVLSATSLSKSAGLASCTAVH